jgi:phage baseplate assembly protein W
MPISNPVNISPTDLRPDIGIGVDIPFNKPGVFSPNYTTKKSIRNNLINFFLTNTGERFMNPTFGGGLRNFLFSQAIDTNTNILQQEIQEKINSQFPLIGIGQLTVTPTPDTHTVTINLSYFVKNTNIKDSITIEFNQ